MDGTFKLEGVPSGKDVPLVIQVGKWRREVKLDLTLDKCAMNAVANKELTRLPKNKSEGHIPRIAVTTGQRDALAWSPLMHQGNFHKAARFGRVRFVEGTAR